MLRDLHARASSPAGEDAAAASAFRFFLSSLDVLPSFLGFFIFGDFAGVVSVTIVSVAIVGTTHTRTKLGSMLQLENFELAD